jgi:hypothetical protein
MAALENVRTSMGLGRYILFAAFLALVLLFSSLDRTNFTQLALVYGGLFALYGLILLPRQHHADFPFGHVLAAAIVARLLLLFSEPNLSDDYFRFIWDGRLPALGINPFDFTPEALIHSDRLLFPQADLLYEHMNSKGYFSLYPPVSQGVFRIAGLLSPARIFPAVLVMKLVILLAELVSVYSLYRICRVMGYPVKRVLWYALNPLVIIEFTGNLHFEAVMIALLLLSILLLITGRWIPAAIAYAGAVLTKVHPLMLLPFIMVFLGWKRGWRFTFLTAAIILAAYLPLLLPAEAVSWRLENMLASFRLYFGSFEFNAGIYNIFRWIGYQTCGYNAIDIVGKLMLAFQLILLTVLLYRMKRTARGLIGVVLLAYLVFILFSTTVHPWYILPMLPFAVLTGLRTITLWTALVFLSYFAYSQAGWQEHFGLLTLEYTCIFAGLLYEFNDRLKLHGIIH